VHWTLTRSWWPRATAGNTLSFYGFCIEVRRVGGEVLVRDLIEVARHPISGSGCIIEALQVPRFSTLRHSVSRWLCQPD